MVRCRHLFSSPRKSQRRQVPAILLLIVLLLLLTALSLLNMQPWAHTRDQLLWKLRSAGVMVWNRYHEKFTPAVIRDEINEEDKVILFWTPFFGHLEYNVGYGREPFKNCPVDRCVTTNQRALLNRSSAVIFHPVEFSDMDLPEWRSPEQLWTFFMLESPPNTGGVFTAQTRALFNITMTYRRDSDIVQPYYLIERKSTTENTSLMPKNSEGETEEHKELNSTSTPGKDSAESPRLAWIVSNCHTVGGREKFVTELSDYIDIDIFGRCGPLTCSEPGSLLNPPDPDLCYKYIQRRYRFYLSLENSKCRDYITEKFFLALHHNLIPIVYGAARSDYEAIAPPNSFIFAADFSTPRQLAEFIRHVSSDRDKMAQFGQWRHIYRVRRVLTDGFCALCLRIQEKPVVKQNYPDINRWWSYEDVCQQ